MHLGRFCNLQDVIFYWTSPKEISLLPPSQIRVNSYSKSGYAPPAPNVCCKYVFFIRLLSAPFLFCTSNVRFLSLYEYLSRFTQFWKTLDRKVFFLWVNTVFLGQEVHYYMVRIVYYNELNLQIGNCARKRPICRKNSKYAPDENIVAILAFLKGCQLLPPCVRAIIY